MLGDLAGKPVKKMESSLKEEEKPHTHSPPAATGMIMNCIIVVTLFYALNCIIVVTLFYAFTPIIVWNWCVR